MRVLRRRRHASPSKTLASPTSHLLFRFSSPLCDDGSPTSFPLCDSGFMLNSNCGARLLSSVRREKDAQVCLYDASWDTHFCFCCDIDGEISSQLAIDAEIVVTEVDESKKEDDSAEIQVRNHSSVVSEDKRVLDKCSVTPSLDEVDNGHDPNKANRGLFCILGGFVE